MKEKSDGRPNRRGVAAGFDGNPRSQVGNPKSLSRREWLLNLGEAAVLLGFSGVELESETEKALATPLHGPDIGPLPPGLYAPSNDHLTHALTSDTLYHPIPPDSETDYIRAPNEPFKPQFFRREEFETVQQLVARMLGKTERSAAEGGDSQAEDVAEIVAEWIDLVVASSPGVRDAARRLAPEHRALAVAYYGSERPLQELEMFDPAKTCREGLRWLDEECERRYQHPFCSLEESAQVEVLKSIGDDQPDKAVQNAGTRLFQFIKAEVIRGYYTSRAGLQALDYKGNAFYAESPGCPGHENGK